MSTRTRSFPKTFSNIALDAVKVFVTLLAGFGAAVILYDVSPDTSNNPVATLMGIELVLGIGLGSTFWRAKYNDPPRAVMAWRFALAVFAWVGSLVCSLFYNM